MNQLFERLSKCGIVFCSIVLLLAGIAFAQAVAEEPQEKSAEASTTKASEKIEEPPNAAQIELLETKYRFEANGDSRKEVHAIVKINSELGVRQFARLNFDYNRSFQSVEIPLVHITHESGGTADILPSAITDAPNSAVEKFPAYQDIRVKSVRVLGLQPGDTLEYRVITITTKPPLAPDFWLGHSFDRTGVVTEETFELDLPASRGVDVRINPETPPDSKPDSIPSASDRAIYRWHHKRMPASTQGKPNDGEANRADIAVTTFASWDALASALMEQLNPTPSASREVSDTGATITGIYDNQTDQIAAIFKFVSTKIRTVDLPLGATGFHTRKPKEILTSGYATPEDKYALFNALTFPHYPPAQAALSGPTTLLSTEPAMPSSLSTLLIQAGAPCRPIKEGKKLILATHCTEKYWLAPALEVAPFNMVPQSLRGRQVLIVRNPSIEEPFLVVPNELPFRAKQRVRIEAVCAPDGQLSAKVTYNLRGDNELLLRVAFHQTPPEKQKEIAQYLALSDGFRGKVTNVKTSDPYETDKPFEVEYELTQEKFVDWSKKPVRIPALLPLPGLPEAPKKSSSGTKIELGPPLDVELSGTLRLPAGTTAQVPPGTSVKRDYATFASQYSAKLNILHFSRHLKFIAPELPNDRALDLNAFLHAVQNDQALLFELQKPDSPAPAKPK